METLHVDPNAPDILDEREHYAKTFSALDQSMVFYFDEVGFDNSLRVLTRMCARGTTPVLTDQESAGTRVNALVLIGVNGVACYTLHFGLLSS